MDNYDVILTVDEFYGLEFKPEYKVREVRLAHPNDGEATVQFIAQECPTQIYFFAKVTQ